MNYTCGTTPSIGNGTCFGGFGWNPNCFTNNPCTWTGNCGPTFGNSVCPPFAWNPFNSIQCFGGNASCGIPSGCLGAACPDFTGNGCCMTQNNCTFAWTPFGCVPVALTCGPSAANGCTPSYGFAGASCGTAPCAPSWCPPSFVGASNTCAPSGMWNNWNSSCNTNSSWQPCWTSPFNCSPTIGTQSWSNCCWPNQSSWQNCFAPNALGANCFGTGASCFAPVCSPWMNNVACVPTGSWNGFQGSSWCPPFMQSTSSTCCPSPSTCWSPSGINCVSPFGGFGPIASYANSFAQPWCQPFSQTWNQPFGCFPNQFCPPFGQPFGQACGPMFGSMNNAFCAPLCAPQCAPFCPPFGANNCGPTGFPGFYGQCPPTQGWTGGTCTTQPNATPSTKSVTGAPSTTGTSNYCSPTGYNSYGAAANCGPTSYGDACCQPLGRNAA